MASSTDWTLVNFEERFDAWVSLSKPSADLLVIVLDWIMTRHIDPHQDVERQPGFPDLWYGRVPNSGDGCGNVVVCSYRIEESTHTVICNDFTTLGFPA